LRWLPIIIFVIVIAIIFPSLASLVVLGVVAATMLLDYFVLSKYSEKLIWHLIFKRFYGKETTPEGYDVMKEYEQNPSEENRKKLTKELGGK
jgi:hypothetical protein